MIVYDPTTPTRGGSPASTNGGGVYKTVDNGVTFKALGNVTHTDSVAVDFSDPSRMTLLAGGHESARSSGGLWMVRHLDNVGLNLPAGSSFSSNAVVFDAQTHIVGLSGYAGKLRDLQDDGRRNLVVSTNTAGPSPAPLVASDGSVWWTIIYSNGILRSTDKGATFTKPTSQYNALADVKPIELPDHRTRPSAATSRARPRASS